MNRDTRHHLHRLFFLTRDMLALANRGDTECAEDRANILFGIVRDAAYRLRRMTREELVKAQRDREMLN